MGADRIFVGENTFRLYIKRYLRYIDDLLLVVDKGIHRFSSLLKDLNANNKNLAFTCMVDNRKICYLDVCLTGKAPHTEIAFYRKPLLGNTLLLAQSGHYKHTKKVAPVGQFLRISCIFSSE